jgi:peptidoglycan/xylan/chitin deacetylase (PgdA/CDA1 family)
MIRAPRPLPPGIKRRLLAAADHGLGVASIGDFYARATGARGAVILMYHSVAASERRWLQDPSMAMPASKFAAQMSFLARRRRVISLTALAETLARGNAPERGTVVITFDDGYLDNYRVAAPILARHDFPATIFLATGYIERVENMWIDTIYHAFARRTRDAFEIVGRAFDLSNSSELDRAYAETAGVLVRARVPERAAILSSILEQLRPSGQPPRLTMSWDDVRALRKSYPGISIGSHTREHVNLSNMPDAEVVGELDAAHADIRRARVTWLLERFADRTDEPGQRR